MFLTHNSRHLVRSRSQNFLTVRNRLCLWLLLAELLAINCGALLRKLLLRVDLVRFLHRCWIFARGRGIHCWANNWTSRVVGSWLHLLHLLEHFKHLEHLFLVHIALVLLYSGARNTHIIGIDILSTHHLIVLEHVLGWVFILRLWVILVLLGELILIPLGPVLYQVICIELFTISCGSCRLTCTLSFSGDKSHTSILSSAFEAEEGLAEDELILQEGEDAQDSSYQADYDDTCD